MQSAPCSVWQFVGCRDVGSKRSLATKPLWRQTTSLDSLWFRHQRTSHSRALARARCSRSCAICARSRNPGKACGECGKSYWLYTEKCRSCRLFKLQPFMKGQPWPAWRFWAQVQEMEEDEEVMRAGAPKPAPPQGVVAGNEGSVGGLPPPRTSNQR